MNDTKNFYLALRKCTCIEWLQFSPIAQYFFKEKVSRMSQPLTYLSKMDHNTVSLQNFPNSSKIIEVQKVTFSNSRLQIISGWGQFSHILSFLIRTIKEYYWKFQKRLRSNQGERRKKKHASDESIQNDELPSMI